MWRIQQLSLINIYSKELGLSFLGGDFMFTVLVFSLNESVLTKHLPVRCGTVKFHGILGGNDPQFC